MSTKAWKSRFAYNSKNAVEHKVNGHTMRFYPNRIGLLNQLAEISKPISHAVATLFGNTDQDRSSSNEQIREGVKKAKDGSESYNSESNTINVLAVTPELASFRRTERNSAIDELLEGLTNKRNRLLLGELLMDSLRDDFPYQKDRTPADVEEFLFGDNEGYEGLDMPVLVEMISGWLKANAKVFGNVGEKVAAIVQGKLGALQNPSLSEGTTNTVDGSSSKTPSSLESASDLESSISSS